MKIPFGVLLFVAAVSTGFGYTANNGNKTISTNGSYSDTASAVAYVAAKNQDGWVMTVGTAGSSYTWASQLSINIPHVFTIQGASPSNRPTITSTVSGGQGIILDCTTLKTITVKDLIFAEWTPVNCLFLVSGGGVDCFRFTNVKWIHAGRSAVAYIAPVTSGRTDAGPYGLIDHCEVLGSGYGFFIRDNNSVASWDRAMTWGTREATYIEDCTFGNTSFISGRPAVDSNNGSRYVFRHNTLINQVIANHGADTSGLTGSSLQSEVMHNSFRMTVAGNPAGTFFCFINYRGGTNLIFDNSFIGDSPLESGSPIREDYFRGTAGNGNVTVDRFYSADYVGTQQPGSGHVASAGQDPNFPAKAWGRVPVRIWSNTHSGIYYSFSESPPSVLKSGVKGSFFRLNRDWFESSDATAAMPGYTEYTYPHPLNEPRPPANLRAMSPTPTP